MRDLFRWSVAFGEGTTSLSTECRSGRYYVFRDFYLSPVLRDLGAGDRLGLTDARRFDGTVGRIYLLCRRLGEQGRGVTARTPLPALEPGLLAEIASIGVGPDPGATKGRRYRIGTLALAPVGSQLLHETMMWPVGGEPFAMGVPLPEAQAAMVRAGLIAASPKASADASWELHVTTDRRSGPYAITVAMDVFTEADLQRLVWTKGAIQAGLAE